MGVALQLLVVLAMDAFRVMGVQGHLIGETKEIGLGMSVSNVRVRLGKDISCEGGK